jgi:L-Ala-D/L-Glu epimerase
VAGPTTIREVHVERLDLELREPFGISGGAQLRAENLLVTVTLEDGTVGLGEAAPFPAFNGETQAAAERAAQAAGASLVGADARGWREAGAEIAAHAGGVGSARCALETAVLDALCRRARIPLWSLFGGASTELRTDLTVTTGSLERAGAAAAAIAARGFGVIKVKIGADTLDADVARLRAVHQAAPACALIVDANAAFDSATALRLCEAIRRHGLPVALLEQPVAAGDLDALAAVSQSGGLTVAADESVSSAADARAIAERHAAGVLNIKPMKCGFVEALEIAAVARVHGLGTMIGAMVESVLATSASACFAAGLGGFDFVDLDTPEWFAQSPFRGGYRQDGPRLLLDGIEAGHGVDLEIHTEDPSRPRPGPR